jgi:hypothetical protein
MHTRNRICSVVAMAAVLMMFFASAALADNVQNDVTAGGNNTVTAGGETQIRYRVVGTGGDSGPLGPGGNCNVSTTNPGTLTINVPAGVVASAASVQFTSCGDYSAPVTFSSNTPGVYPITHSMSGGQGLYSMQANFNLTVNPAPVTEVAPTVTPVISGGTAGDSGWYKGGTVGLSWTIIGTPIPTVDEGADCGSRSINTDGAHSITCSVTNSAGSASNTATIRYDSTAPTVAVYNVFGTAGNNGWYTSDVTVTFRATDATSGFEGPSLTQDEDVESSGEGSNVAVNSPAFTDLAGNTVAAGDKSPTYKIDLSNPTNIQFLGGPAAGSSHYFGNAPAAPTCTADDIVSGLSSCDVTGYSTAVGNHTLTATATDNAGNRETASRSYTVLAWDISGLYKPVDMGGVWNSAKGGSTIPLKFEVFAGATELKDLTTVDAKLSQKKVACDNGAPIDEVPPDMLASGSTALRFDTSGDQFIYNWKTPAGAGCYEVKLSTADGSSVAALFNLRK